MLSLPFVLAAAGFIPGMIMMGWLAWASASSATMILRAGKRTHGDLYYQIVQEEFGNTAGRLAEAMVLLCLFVAAVSYVVGLADLIPDMFPIFEGFSRYGRVFFIMLGLFPLTLISNLSVFGPSSALACIGCYILAFALVVETITSFLNHKISFHVGPLFAVKPMGILLSLPLVSFTYAYHYVLTDVVCELRAPSMVRLVKTVNATTALLYGCYFFVAISGFLLMNGSEVPDDILAGLGSTSLAVLISRWSIALLLFATYSLFIIPLRRRLEELWYGSMTRSVGRDRLQVALIIAASVGGISAVLPSLGLANAVAGGCIALVMFLFPGLLSMRSGCDTRRGKHDLPTKAAFHNGIAMAFLGIIVCIVGILQAII